MILSNMMYLFIFHIYFNVCISSDSSSILFHVILFSVNGDEECCMNTVDAAKG